MRYRIITKLFCTTCALYLFFSCSENELFELSPNAEEANKSYVNQFKAIWVALDLNYPIWDYERDEYGLNWDDVYDEYLPKFAHLDSLYEDTGDTLTSSLLIPYYYDKIFSKLHDGHLSARIKDVYTGKEYTNLSLFNKRKTDYILDLYKFSNLYDFIWVLIQDKGVKGHSLLESKRVDDYTYGLFTGNIVYLHFPIFILSKFIDNVYKTDKEKSIIDVWNTWFSTVQEMHNNGSLKGVILDVRGNEGGYACDYQYYLGALHDDVDNCGGILTGSTRLKFGSGRYDYFQTEGGMPFPVYHSPHANITAPIVILADSTSASLAEQTCLAAKKLPNAKVIGTNTYGAESPLIEEKGSAFTDYGQIGDPELSTSTFYISIPFAAFLTLDNKIIEGKGVTPDIFVARDWTYTGDNQLERAFEYIDTGY